MTLTKCLFKLRDDVLDDTQEHLQLFSRVHPLKRLNVFEKYLEGKISLESRLFGIYPLPGFDSEPQELILTAQKVTGVDSFSGNDFTWRIGDNPKFQSSGNNSNDTQPPVPVESSQVMNVSQAGAQASIRIVERFHSFVRLYSLKPILKLFREWELEETAVLEFCDFPVKNGKLQSICIGGGSVP